MVTVNQAEILLLINKIVKDYVNQATKENVSPNVFKRVKKDVTRIFQLFDLTINTKLESGETLETKSGNAFKCSGIIKCHALSP